VVNIGKIVVTPDWFSKPRPVSTGSGMHRILWDLHFSLEEELRGEESKDGTYPTGIWALPGTYQVKLHAGEQTLERKLIVKNDPRVKVSPSDLFKQFEFAQRIIAERMRVATGIREAKNLLKQAEAIREKAPQQLADQIAAFESEITNLTEVRAIPFQPGMPGSFPLKVDSFSYLAKVFADLQHATDDADAAPSVDALAGFEKQHLTLEQTLLRWEQLKNGSLQTLNAALKKQDLEPLTP
jgi:hypothetical protein